MERVVQAEPRRANRCSGRETRPGGRGSAFGLACLLVALVAAHAWGAEEAGREQTNAQVPSTRTAAVAAVPVPAKPAPPLTWAEQQSDLCAAAVRDAEARYPLPPGLIGTIAKVESGRPVTAMNDVRAWPWTIDADGKGYFFESKAAAVVWAQEALARGVNFMDIGCMQVDLQMHPGAFRSLDEAFDPSHNVDYGARFLQRLHDNDANGNWYVAVGLYHSHTPDRAAAYRDRVAAVGRGIVTGFGAPEPLYMRALRQGTLRLALAGGGVMVLRLRQPSERPHPRMNACQVVAFLGSDLPARAQARGCRSHAG